MFNVASGWYVDTRVLRYVTISFPSYCSSIHVALERTHGAMWFYSKSWCLFWRSWGDPLGAAKDLSPTIGWGLQDLWDTPLRLRNDLRRGHLHIFLGTQRSLQVRIYLRPFNKQPGIGTQGPMTKDKAHGLTSKSSTSGCADFDMQSWCKTWLATQRTQSSQCKTNTSQETQKELTKVLGADKETKGIWHWQFLGIRQTQRRPILESFYVNTTQIGNKWDC